MLAKRARPTELRMPKVRAAKCWLHTLDPLSCTSVVLQCSHSQLVCNLHTPLARSLMKHGLLREVVVLRVQRWASGV